MRPLVNPEPEPRLTPLIELLDLLVRSDQMFKNWQGFRTTLWSHSHQIRGPDYANDVADFKTLARHIFPLQSFHRSTQSREAR
jgi:hypothetical protein